MKFYFTGIMEGKFALQLFSIPVMYVKTMDTLKPLEQLILKAGSALGYTFKRDTLKFVIFSNGPADEKALGRGEFPLQILNRET